MSSSPYDMLDTEQIIHIFASTIITEVLGLEYRPATDGVAGTLSIPPDVQRRLVSLIEMKERLTQNLEKDTDLQRAAFALQHALLTHLKARASELGLIDHGYNRSILSLSALLQEDLLKETKRGGQPTAEAEKWDKTAAFVEACFKIAALLFPDQSSQVVWQRVATEIVSRTLETGNEEQNAANIKRKSIDISTAKNAYLRYQIENGHTPRRLFRLNGVFKKKSVIQPTEYTWEPSESEMDKEVPQWRIRVAQIHQEALSVVKARDSQT